MNYRDRLYSKYVGTHTNSLYGDISIEKIKYQFSLWNYYFGRFFPNNKSKKILDIGCGNGDLIYWIQSLGFKEAYGIDISDDQVSLANRLGIPHILQTDLFIFLKERENFYDVVVARDILEHLSKNEVINALDLVFNALRSDGTLIIQTLNAENIFWGRLRHADFTHEVAFTKESLRQVLIATGFNDINIYPQKPMIHGFISFIRYICLGFVVLFFKFYLSLETGSSKGIFTQNIIAVAKKK